MSRRPVWSTRMYERGLPLLLIAAAVAVYANSFAGVFLFDDRPAIVERDRIRQLWPPWAVLTSRRPVVELSLAVNYTFGELDPWGYHLVNLAIHILAGLTLFGVVRRILLHAEQGAQIRKARSWLAFTISLIWLVHPLQTQSVTYIIQRSESLMGLFYLLTVYCVIRGAASARRGPWYLLATVSCAMGMGAKGVMVSAPVLVLLFDRVLLAGSWRQLWERRWSLYLGLTMTWTILWWCGIVQSLLNTSAIRATVGFGFKGITPLEYFLTQPGVVLHYLRLALWPHPLCLDYTWPVAEGPVSIIVPLGVMAMCVVGVVWCLWRRSWLGCVGAWFFVILLPTSSFIPIKDPLFEHRMYLPLAAVVTVFVIAGHTVLTRLIRNGALAQHVQRWTAAVAVTAISVILGSVTIARNRDYRSELGMWRDIVLKRPNNARGHYSLGTALMKETRWGEAIEELREAVRVDRTYVDAHYNLGNALRHGGRSDEAIAAYREAVRLDPRQTMARLNLANLLQQQVGGMKEAIEHYREVARLESDMVVAHVNLGKALLRLGRMEEAVESFRQAVLLEPQGPGPHFGLAVALDGIGRLDEAVEEYRETLRLQPSNAEARRSLEAALAKQKSR